MAKINLTHLVIRNLSEKALTTFKSKSYTFCVLTYTHDIHQSNDILNRLRPNG